VSRVSDHLQERLAFEADIMVGTQLCSRRLLQQIIYCVGGISVFFPLITQSDRCESETLNEETSAMPTKERMTAEVIELIASVLDENPANQQQMHLLAGFPILGFLLQSIQPKQLNLETLSSLKHLFNVISSSGTCCECLILILHFWYHILRLWFVVWYMKKNVFLIVVCVGIFLFVSYGWIVNYFL